MGHRWSLFFCQKAIEEAIWAIPSCQGAEIHRDDCGCVIRILFGKRSRSHPCDRSPRRFFYVYVDNLGVLGTSREKVANDLMMAIQTLKSRGLNTYEEAIHSDSATALGIHIHLRNMLVSVAPTRLWRLKQGLRWALCCRALPGKTWEVLLGHMTFVALRRDVLRVPYALNKFIRANYESSVKLWPSASAEVQALVGLLPAISSNWTRDWCSCICRDRCKRAWLWCLSGGVREERLPNHRTDK